MNLTKLFNKDYAIQNIKKSKGMLILMLLIVPIVTLFSIYISDKYYYGNPITIVPYTWPAVIGMVIIPIILSILLLGYVYKKNKVDFINSMPIKRKTIFMTNLILGIVFILLLQLLTLGINGLYLAFNPESRCVFDMMVDMFIVMFLSYTYVFSTCVLALTLSGNIMTQIVISLLLILLPPFVYGSMVVLKENYYVSPDLVVEQKDATQTFSTIRNSVIFNYNVMPISTLEGIIDDDNNMINAKDVTMTIIVTLINIFLGMYIFERRKMENNGTSFETIKAHILVKALTLYPMAYGVMVYIVGAADDINLAILAFLVFIIFMYYLIYDFITAKKIKFKVSLISFALIFGIMTGSLVLINNTVENTFQDNKQVRLDRNAVSHIALENQFSYGKIERRVEIVDKDLINNIIDNMVPAYGNRENNFEIYDQSNNTEDVDKLDYNNPINLHIPVGNKEYTISVILPKGFKKELYEKTKNLDENIAIYKGDTIDTEIVYYLNDVNNEKVKASKDSNIVKEINKEIRNSTIKYHLSMREGREYSNLDNQNMITENSIERFNETLMVYFYKNGKVHKYSLNTKDLSDEIRNEIYNSINIKVAKKINKEKITNEDYLKIVNYYVPLTNARNDFSRSYYMKNNQKELVNYFVESALNNIDINDKVVRFEIKLDSGDKYEGYNLYVQLNDKFKEKFPEVYNDIINGTSIEYDGERIHHGLQTNDLDKNSNIEIESATSEVTKVDVNK